MMTQYSGTERRRYPRINIDFVVGYRMSDEREGDLTQSKNASQGGMLLTTHRRFDKGSRLMMTMRLPFLSQKIDVQGEVVDSKEVAKNLIYETRIKFINLEEAIFNELGKFLGEKKKM